MSLADQIKAKSSKLRHCTTKVTDVTGVSHVETRDGDGIYRKERLHREPRSYGFVVDTKPDLRVSQILPQLLLTSQDVAYDQGLLEKYQVTHILNLLPPAEDHYLLLSNDGRTVKDEQGESVDIAHSGHTYRIHYPLMDTPEQYMVDAFSTCSLFLEWILGDENRVLLVHCNAGVSRAPSIVIAYLMKRFEYSFEEAFQFVKERRSYIRPNEGFVRQLKSMKEV